MEVNLIEKESFIVIGKLGQGFSNKCPEWIPPLWSEANNSFNEIINLAKFDETGNIVGVWGAMSDIDVRFEPWDKQGKYLAGCEAIDNANAPKGWTKWVIPGYKYAVVKCSKDTYEDVFNYMVDEYLPENEYSIVGAVHEFYDPKDTNGELYLYFPIKKL